MDAVWPNIQHRYGTLDLIIQTKKMGGLNAIQQLQLSGRLTPAALALFDANISS